MRLGIQRERSRKERRVAVVPGDLPDLANLGFEVVVEGTAGDAAGFDDDAYRDAGATVADGDAVASADVTVGVNGTVAAEGDGPAVRRTSGVALALFDPLWRPDGIRDPSRTAEAVLALELVPRIARAQSMDVLSSMATITGYEAALLAAQRLPQMFPLMMTAAGTLAPARVVVIGAGVAGLQAIATCRRLGAVVEAYDVRPDAVEQIKSVGAKAIELDIDTSSSQDAGGYAKENESSVLARQQELLAAHVGEADVVITTAAIPGRASPVLISAAMVESMAKGSVIIDLAAERGGNCVVTKPDEEIELDGVIVLGPTDLASQCARHASMMFSRNVVAILEHNLSDGDLTIDPDDGITGAMLVARGGEIVHAGVLAALAPGS